MNKFVSFGKIRKVVAATTVCILFALGGCSKYDDSDLWDEVRRQESRLAALETWQAQVNTNLQSLQGLVNAMNEGDVITSVTTFDAPEPGGYIISFQKGANITIYNGTKGDTGDTGGKGDTGEKGEKGDTPQIGIAEFPSGSGLYYWTLNGDFIEVGGNKMPATGENVALKLRINEGEWEVSYNNGQTWESLGVGTGGGGGDAIFSAVDDSHPDYVVFTLVAGGELRIAKYKTLDLIFEQPEGFDVHETKTVNFTTSGSVAFVTLINVTTGWKVTVNLAGNSGSFSITSPETFNEDNMEGEAIALASDGGDRTVMRKMLFFQKEEEGPVEGLPASWMLPDKAQPNATTGNSVDFTDFVAHDGTADLNVGQWWVKSDDENSILRAYRAGSTTGVQNILWLTTNPAVGDYVQLAGQIKNDYWQMEIPTTGLDAGTALKIEGEMQVSATGPSDILFQYSTDQSTWTPINPKIEDDITYTVRMLIGEAPGYAAIKTPINETFTITSAIPAGTLYIRMMVSSSVRASRLGNFTGTAGTWRITRPQYTGEADKVPIMKVTKL